MKFTTTDQAAQLHGVKILTYGKAGYGKTVLASTAPVPIIISAEAGLLSLRHLRIPVVEINTLQDLIQVHTWASSSREAAQFQTVCLDSITEIAEKVLANAKTQVKDPRQAYGELLDKMQQVIRAFRDLPGKHVYFSAKQEQILDGGVASYGPSMPGSKLGQMLPYFFDEVFRLGIGKLPDGTQYRFLQTQPDFQFDAKDRSGALANPEEPNLTVVINKIQNPNVRPA